VAGRRGLHVSTSLRRITPEGMMTSHCNSDRIFQYERHKGIFMIVFETEEDFQKAVMKAVRKHLDIAVNVSSPGGLKKVRVHLVDKTTELKGAFVTGEDVG
jgi:hypothetical protein